MTNKQQEAALKKLRREYEKKENMVFVQAANSEFKSYHEAIKALQLLDHQFDGDAALIDGKSFHSSITDMSVILLTNAHKAGEPLPTAAFGYLYFKKLLGSKLHVTFVDDDRDSAE